MSSVPKQASKVRPASPELLFSYTHHPNTIFTHIITMASKSITRMGSASLRRCFRAPIASQITARSSISRACVATTAQRHVVAIRSFHSSIVARGIMPDAENPKPRESEDIEDPKAPTELSTEEYNQLADAYLEELVTKLEGEAEKNPAVDVEYSVHMASLSNSHISTDEMVGWRARSQRGRQRYLCPQQAAPEQADLAQLPNIWTEAL
jgi:hypothetical protein